VSSPFGLFTGLFIGHLEKLSVRLISLWRVSKYVTMQFCHILVVRYSAAL
jgi:hypothetical protein